MTAGVLILAAGRAQRFGTDKRLATLGNGRSVLDSQLARVRASDLPFLVCLAGDDQPLAEWLQQQEVPHVLCDRASEGMGSTLAQGIEHIPDWRGVLIALADMPWIASSTYCAVAAQLSAGAICVPEHNGLRGLPVGFSREYYSELAALEGDKGAKDLLLQHAGSVVPVPVDDPAIHWDIDRPEDLARAADYSSS